MLITNLLRETMKKLVSLSYKHFELGNIKVAMAYMKSANDVGKQIDELSRTN